MWRALSRIKIVTHLFLPISSKAGASGLPFPVTYGLSVTACFSCEPPFFYRSVGLVVVMTLPLWQLKQRFLMFL